MSTAQCCHGAQAQGVAKQWRESLVDGNDPPPPLDGSAHAWHRHLGVLQRRIRFGGQLPAFGEKLDDEERLAISARFQDEWNDDIHSLW